MNSNFEENKLKQDLLKALSFGLFWTAMILFSAFLISRWLTRLLFEKVLNPLTNSFFERNDGAVVILSILIWAVIGEALLFGYMYAYPQTMSWNSQDYFWATLTFGGAWGAMIGGWLVLTWWSEIANAPMVVSDFKQALNLPSNFYQRTS